MPVRLKMPQHQKHLGYGARELIVYLWMHCDHNYNWYLVHFIQNSHVLTLRRKKSFMFSISFRFLSFILEQPGLKVTASDISQGLQHLVSYFCFLHNSSLWFSLLKFPGSIYDYILSIPLVQARTIGTLSQEVFVFISGMAGSPRFFKMYQWVL